MDPKQCTYCLRTGHQASHCPTRLLQSKAPGDGPRAAQRTLAGDGLLTSMRPDQVAQLAPIFAKFDGFQWVVPVWLLELNIAAGGSNA